MYFGKDVPGLCDRCGLRFRLKDLHEEYVLGRATGLLTCPQCHDESHPQLDTRGIQTNDQQSVNNPRSDMIERDDSRRLFAWNPVGCEATGYAEVQVGRVRVVIT